LCGFKYAASERILVGFVDVSDDLQALAPEVLTHLKSPEVSGNLKGV